MALRVQEPHRLTGLWAGRAGGVHPPAGRQRRAAPARGHGHQAGACDPAPARGSRPCVPYDDACVCVCVCVCPASTPQPALIGLIADREVRLLFVFFLNCAAPGRVAQLRGASAHYKRRELRSEPNYRDLRMPGHVTQETADCGNKESAESATCRRFLARHCKLHTARVAAQW